MLTHVEPVLSSTKVKIYPNPVRDVSTIEFNLQKKSLVKIQVFDSGGRKVQSIVGREYGAGRHQIDWKANFDKGFYLLKLQTDEAVICQKIMKM